MVIWNIMILKTLVQKYNWMQYKTRWTEFTGNARHNNNNINNYAPLHVLQLVYDTISTMSFLWHTFQLHLCWSLPHTGVFIIIHTSTNRHIHSQRSCSCRHETSAFIQYPTRPPNKYTSSLLHLVSYNFRTEHKK